MEAAKGNGKVQHVTKASSDQLLRKFAEMDSESEDRDLAKKELRLAKRRKKILQPKVDATSTSLVFGERKSLLGSQRSVALIPRTAKLRARDIKNRSFLGAIEKTWRRTVQGASKVFIEKHYNRHRRLISDTS
ncbi:hypothetical protein P3S67_031917 [Capsicum chacoense]|uniref:Uncharacterized protein n=1 Tax=Capsicum annuum TaxID=4072 RepID=A0A1U8GHB0_CAPAN|nr:uncharacterized protein LOC107865810 [Capsicum annuum]XP_016567487.1 uncharacterized protein LOC107865810 [Capsicum annuum]XP_016567488.1 uncharacterized protein LOC107865810 [Capsicum annuum]XP_016567490.1 uncharacterized protein LOC107865810 [Capsicum annuum]KAF3654425.1 putative protein phosphatase 2C 43-like [Capsicum annuum]PHT88915.1 hypothetical protein T459_11021 [Capsicum annuum]